MTDRVQWPVGPDGWYISTLFGARPPEYVYYNAIHTGLDLNWGSSGDADLGQPVYAVAAGRVEYALNTGAGFGNLLVIRLDSGVWTRCAHLRAFGPGVKAGAAVARGQVVGYVGKSGGTTYAHLHFDVIHARPPASVGGWCNWPGTRAEMIHAYYLDPAKFLTDRGNKAMAVRLG